MPITEAEDRRVAWLRAEEVLGLDPGGESVTGTPSASTALYGDRTWKATPTLAQLADTTSVSNGDALIGMKRTATNAVARTLHTYYEYDILHAQRDFGAIGNDSADDTVALQSWAAAVAISGIQGRLGVGTFKITTAITHAGGALSGHSVGKSAIHAYGCDAFDVTGSFVSVTDMQLRSSSSGGSADPKTHKGIDCIGTSGTHINDMQGRNLYLRGWLNCVNWDYTWSSVLDNVETINCEYSLRLFGQSVNNSVTNSRFVANTGTASILTVKDGGTQGEGLMVSGTLMATGAKGVVSDGFLAMHFDNCITDLITDIAFDLTGVAAFSYLGGWVYATNRCFNFNDVGSLADLGNTISTYATTTAANSIPVYWGTNNLGLSISGGEYTAPNASNVYCLYFNGSKVSIGAACLSDNSSSTHSVFIAGSDIFGLENLSGDVTIQWNASPAVAVASAGTIALTRHYGRQFLLSGSTNVDTITATGWDGETIIIVSTGTATLKDGTGNMKLAGDFVTTADDVATLTCVGTTWYECGRSVN